MKAALINTAEAVIACLAGAFVALAWVVCSLYDRLTSKKEE